MFLFCEKDNINKSFFNEVTTAFVLEVVTNACDKLTCRGLEKNRASLATKVNDFSPFENEHHS